MNKARRKSLEKANELLQQALDIIRETQEEEQGAYDNMPEGLQGSERGEQMQEYTSILEEAADSLEDYSSQIQEIIEG